MSSPSVFNFANLSIFIDLVSRYFLTVTGSEPKFGEASIELGAPDLYAYSGFIQVGGPLEGWICISHPEKFQNALLKSIDEPMQDEATRLDLVGEVASTIAANAREHFGQRLQIQPPLITGDASIAKELVLPPLTYLLPYSWRDHNAFLLVGLNS
jgi:chemotaxis protein CheX